MVIYNRSLRVQNVRILLHCVLFFRTLLRTRKVRKGPGLAQKGFRQENAAMKLSSINDANSHNWQRKGQHRRWGRDRRREYWCSEREREREREGRHTWSRAHAQNSAVLSLASRWSTSERCALPPRSQDRTPSIEPRDAAEKRERAVRPLFRRDIDFD